MHTNKTGAVLAAALLALGIGTQSASAVPQAIVTPATAALTAGDAGGQVIAVNTYTQLGQTLKLNCPSSTTNVCMVEMRAQVSVDYGPGGDNRIYICGAVDGNLIGCPWPVGQPSGAQQTFNTQQFQVALTAGVHTLQGYVYTSKGLHAHYYSYLWQMYRAVQ